MASKDTGWNAPGVMEFVLGLYVGHSIFQGMRGAKVDVQAEQQLQATRDLRAAVRAVESATEMVKDQVEAMTRETGRAQKLAIWVGVGAALFSALLGGFAGAYAAKVVGD